MDGPVGCGCGAVIFAESVKMLSEEIVGGIKNGTPRISA